MSSSGVAVGASAPAKLSVRAMHAARAQQLASPPTSYAPPSTVYSVAASPSPAASSASSSPASSSAASSPASSSAASSPASSPAASSPASSSPASVPAAGAGQSIHERMAALSKLGQQKVESGALAWSGKLPVRGGVPLMPIFGANPTGKKPRKRQTHRRRRNRRSTRRR